jgi:short-subunit dehydrogenase
LKDHGYTRCYLVAEDMAQVVAYKAINNRNFEMTNWVIVTGATSGIGRALTIHFSDLDFNVLAVGRNRNELCVTQSLAITPANITPLVADLSQKSSVNEIVVALRQGDTVKYLVHCAATCEPFAPLLAASQDQVRAAIAVNVKTPFLLTKKLIPFFSRTTRTLFFGSDYVGTTNKIRENLTATYGITKSALDVVVEYLKRENKALQIGMVNPGATNTKMYLSVIAAARLPSNTMQPADPRSVARFIATILINTDDVSFKTEKWDFRNQTQNNRLLQSPMPTPMQRSKL